MSKGDTIFVGAMVLGILITLSWMLGRLANHEKRLYKLDGDH